VSGGTAISNGNVYFGQVSTGALASAEVIKSPTPDMDGNAIAGYINLRTKRAFDRNPGRVELGYRLHMSVSLRNAGHFRCPDLPHWCADYGSVGRTG